MLLGQYHPFLCSAGTPPPCSTDTNSPYCTHRDLRSWTTGSVGVGLHLVLLFSGMPSLVKELWIHRYSLIVIYYYSGFRFNHHFSFASRVSDHKDTRPQPVTVNYLLQHLWTLGLYFIDWYPWIQLLHYNVWPLLPSALQLSVSPCCYVP